MPPHAPQAGRAKHPSAMPPAIPSADELGPVAAPAAAPDASVSAAARLRKLDRSASAGGSLGKGQVLGGGSSGGGGASCSSSPSPSSAVREPEGLRALQKAPAAPPPAGAPPPPFGRAAAPPAAAPTTAPSTPTCGGARRGSHPDVGRPPPLDKATLAPFPEDRLLELLPSPDVAPPKRLWTGVPGISGGYPPATAGNLSSSSSASSSCASSPACGQPAGSGVCGGGGGGCGGAGSSSQPSLQADQLRRPTSGSAARVRRHTTGELGGSRCGVGIGIGIGGGSSSCGGGSSCGAAAPAPAGAVTPPPLRAGVEARRAGDRAAALSDRAAAAVSTSALGALTGGGPAALARSWPPAANGAGAGAAAQQQQRGATPPELDRRLQVGSERRKKRVSFKLADDVRLAAAEGVGESVSWAAENARSLAHTL